MSESNQILSALDPRELGRRLRLARERRGLKQEDAAKIINVARTTLVAIEKGERRIRPAELVRLAIEYGRSVSDFIEQPSYLVQFTQPQFRGPEAYEDAADAQIEQSIELLKELAYDYFALEQRLNTPLAKKYPAEYPVGKLTPAEIGENVALDERQRLGLGDRPIPLMRDLLEQEVGLRIYFFRIQPSAKYSEIYLYSEEIGGCLAVNVLHPEVRNRWSLGHGYGHFLTSRYQPWAGAAGDYSGRRSESEKIADQFTIHFLMPTSGVTRKFNDMKLLKGMISPSDLVEIAHYFGVSFETLCYRLEDLRLVPPGILEVLRNKGFKLKEAQQRLGLEPLSSKRERIPLRHQLLAIQALEKGLISESSFAKLLEVDLLEAREIFQTLTRENLSL